MALCSAGIAERATSSAETRRGPPRYSQMTNERTEFVIPKFVNQGTRAPTQESFRYSR